MLFFIFLVLLILFLSVFCGVQNYEMYNYAADYNHALVTGRLVGGTVWASYPEDTPGLGWIL